MSGFCVYGRSRQVAIERAKNKVPTHEGRRLLSEVEWMEKARAIADEKYLSMKPVKVTQEFDAPQFAEEFIALVERCNTPDLAGLRIMCQGAKTKADGSPMLNKAGQPRTGWVPYSA
ncbi:hypothetical protein [Pandoraea sp. PE-S2R-1]|uniref:hypothetical protein n=1 Tax=Pandoraea sp. PE-S2R-1 TaxID=1986994 RepID=UPI000B403DE9|nr:hypothetical protein [Pandoraea sp. PE-S2R-1]